MGLWPLFDLAVRTPRLVLRLATNDELPELAEKAQLIQPPGTPHLQQDWMYKPDVERQVFQRYWKAIGDWETDCWDLWLVAFLGANPVGVQQVWATDFANVRTVETGSWVGLMYQGMGFGTEMRAGALKLAFVGLTAVEAYSEFVGTNVRAYQISKRLGYRTNGQEIVVRQGQRTSKYYMAIRYDEWKAYQTMDVSLEMTTEQREMFGADSL